VLAEIARHRAARCCQRECVIALQKAAELSHDALPVALRAEGVFDCAQFDDNRECIRAACPLYPASA
jgi:hypothetical protein